MDGSVSNPQARRTTGRRRNLDKIWNSKEHKARVQAFCNGKTCQWCGSAEGLTAHHPYIESYKGAYTDLELCGCIVLCNRCHFSLHKGLVLCPVCKQHYHRVGAEMCKGCFLKANPEIVKQREQFIQEQKDARKTIADARNAKRRAAKSTHPCRSHRIGGKCGLSMVGARCQYSASKALKQCGSAEVKKGVKA